MRDVLIDKWFPINEVRERITGIDYPAANKLHIWFARRPLTTSRAVINASLLSRGQRGEILKLIGIIRFL